MRILLIIVNVVVVLLLIKVKSKNVMERNIKVECKSDKMCQVSLNNRSICFDGYCVCEQGYTGLNCVEVLICDPPCFLSGGNCVYNRSYADYTYSARLPNPVVSNGNQSNDTYCSCNTYWSGDDCGDFIVPSGKTVVYKNTDATFQNLYVNKDALLIIPVQLATNISSSGSPRVLVFNNAQIDGTLTSSLSLYTLLPSYKIAMVVQVLNVLNISKTGHINLDFVSYYSLKFGGMTYPEIASYGGTASPYLCSDSSHKSPCTNPTYGNIFSPDNPGEIGIPLNLTQNNTYAGGGGQLAINVGKSIINEGRISADGGNYSSGGSIHIYSAGTSEYLYTGDNGVISASASKNGGSGGRISITDSNPYYQINLTKISTYGGEDNLAAPGTVFIRYSNDSLGSLYVNSPFFTPYKTEIPRIKTYKFRKVVVSNSTVEFSVEDSITVEKCVSNNGNIFHASCKERIGSDVTSTSSSTTSNNFNHHHDEFSLTMILGIIFGGVAGILMLSILSFVVFHYYSPGSDNDEEHPLIDSSSGRDITKTISNYNSFNLNSNNAYHYAQQLSDDEDDFNIEIKEEDDDNNTSGNRISGYLISHEVLESWLIDFKDIELFHPPLAKGGFGIVHKGIYKKTTVAVKTYLETLGTLPVEDFQRELVISCKLHHPNIVLLIGACPKPLCLVQEFIERGSLWDIICHTPQLLFWARKLSLLADTARGMVYLHNQQPLILHRDLKSANILVTKDWRAKLTDFGLSRSISAGGFMTKQIGTLRYVAPEVLSSNVYNESADIYSFALVMLENVTFKIPFENDTWDSEILEKVCKGIRPSIPPSTPSSYSFLIQQCWSHNIHDRPSFSNILKQLEQMKNFYKIKENK